MWARLGVTFITEFSSSAEVFGNRFGIENVNSVTSNIVGCNGLFLGAFCMYMLVVVPAQLVFVESNMEGKLNDLVCSLGTPYHPINSFCTRLTP